MTAVTTRPALAADEPLLLEVFASTRPELPREIIPMQFAIQDRAYRAQYPEASFLVVEVDGEAGGRLYVQRGPDGISVIDIALLPACRGRGIGESLMRGLLAEAPVRLHVDITNARAEAFYRRLGLRVVAEQGFYRAMAS